MRTTRRVVLYTAKILALCTATILVVSLIINTKLKLICLVASAVFNWLVTHLLDSFERLNRLFELKHLALSLLLGVRLL